MKSLTIGVAHKYLKDKQEKEMKKEEVDNYQQVILIKRNTFQNLKVKIVYTHEV